MLNCLKKADKGIEIIQLSMCGVIMFAMMWLVFFMVFFRYVLNNSIVWAEEVLRYMMMWAVLVGAGLTTRADQHVCIDVLQSILEKWPKLRAVHYVLTRLIVLAFMIYLIFPAFELITRAGSSTATSLTWLHKSVIYSAFPAGCISICLSLFSQVPQKVKAILKGEETDEDIIAARARAAEMDKTLADGGDK